MTASAETMQTEENQHQFPEKQSVRHKKYVYSHCSLSHVASIFKSPFYMCGTEAKKNKIT